MKKASLAPREVGRRRPWVSGCICLGEGFRWGNLRLRTGLHTTLRRGSIARAKAQRKPSKENQGKKTQGDGVDPIFETTS